MPLVLLFRTISCWRVRPLVHTDKDAYAEGVDARVYIPDFFDGKYMPFDYFSDGGIAKNPEFDFKAFLTENDRPYKLKPIMQAVDDLKSLPGVEKVGVVGV